MQHAVQVGTARKTFDSRLCNTVMSLTVDVPFDVTGTLLGHAGLMATPGKYVPPGRTGCPRRGESFGNNRLAGKLGRRFPGAVACLAVHQPP